MPFAARRGLKKREACQRMDRIGTETAFEAAARARALEAKGREHHPPRDR